MNMNYPSSFNDLRDWAQDNNIPVAEAGKRLAQYAILRGITSSRALSELLVFKGGNALDFIWQPNRSTTDLDFSADMDVVAIEVPFWDPVQLKDFLKEHLARGFQIATRDLGVALAIHRINQQPPNPDSTFITYETRVGFALPSDRRNRERLEQGAPSMNVIPVEISLNEPICADERVDLRTSRRLRVCTLEDIVAEKLRALLQQPIRDRTREQDLLDIAVILGAHPTLNRENVAAFLLIKAAARDVPVTRTDFKSADIAARAARDYSALSLVTRRTFLPFDQALQRLHDFVDTLDIPE